MPTQRGLLQAGRQEVFEARCTVQVCVIHPKAQLQPPTKASMYSNAGSPGAEEWGQYARFGYDSDSAKSHGMVIQVAKRLGQLWQPWYQGMLEQAGLQGKREPPRV